MLYSKTNKLFENRTSSRFFLYNKSIECEQIDVPNFVQNLILRKANTYILSKAMIHIDDVLYSDKNLESEYKNKNEWAQFIIDNKQEIDIDGDKELIEEFDYINNLVLNTCFKYK